MTDHKNLTFINKDNNPMVQRWKLAMQQFRFEVVYIPGTENVIADALSRLIGPDEDVLEEANFLKEIDDRILDVEEIIKPSIAYRKLGRDRLKYQRKS